MPNFRNTQQASFSSPENQRRIEIVGVRLRLTANLQFSPTARLGQIPMGNHPNFFTGFRRPIQLVGQGDSISIRQFIAGAAPAAGRFFQHAQRQQLRDVAQRGIGGALGY